MRPEDQSESEGSQGVDVPNPSVTAPEPLR